VTTAGVSAGLGQFCSKAGEVLLARILTGLVGIPFFLGVLYLGKWPLFAVVAGMGLIGFHEYTRIWKAKDLHLPYFLGAALCLGFFLWAEMAPGNSVVPGALMALTVMASLSWLIFQYAKHTILDALVTIAGVAYVGWSLSHLILIRGFGAGTGFDLGLKWIMFAFFCTWAADSFAYWVGMAMGRHKLAPKISPGKSVEGALGGSIGAIVVGWFMGPVVAIAPWQGALIAAVLSVVSVAGDLAESALKRFAGVKDSGTLLPGHGGILDRFDSSLFVLPYVYYVAKLFFVK